MKLAITGKGGVGKTTLASLLARIYAADGYGVVAIDADPDANLASAVGIPSDAAASITPIAEMDELIFERTGAQPGTVGGYFTLNPKVDDIPDRFSARLDGIRLLVMGTVKAGMGCICPESTLIKALVRHLFLRRSEIVIMDMEAGVEHLGRSTAEAVDAFIIVVEPGRRSIQTAQTIRRLASEVGIAKCYVVGSKTAGDNDCSFIKDGLSDFDVLGYIDYSQKILEADRLGSSVFDLDPEAVAAVRKIKDRLEEIDNTLEE
jgi:CO dehydrogenase maturation factor